MRTAGLNTRMVQLVDGNDVNYQSGEMIYQTNDAYNFVDGRPYSWTLAGDGRNFGAMLTPAGLAEIKTYADGVGPWKPQVMALKMVSFKSTNPDRTSFTGALADVSSVMPTSLIADAHKLGLLVHTYPFRRPLRNTHSKTRKIAQDAINDYPVNSSRRTAAAPVDFQEGMARPSLHAPEAMINLCI